VDARIRHQLRACRLPDKDLAAHLRAIYREAGYTEESLAEAMGVSESIVAKIMTGNRRPSARTLALFVRACRGNDADYRKLKYWTFGLGLKSEPKEASQISGYGERSKTQRENAKNSSRAHDEYVRTQFVRIVEQFFPTLPPRKQKKYLNELHVELPLKALVVTLAQLLPPDAEPNWRGPRRK